MRGTELSHAHLPRAQLRSENEALVTGQRTRCATDAAHFLANDDGALDVGAPVDDRDAVITYDERRGRLEGGLHRATPSQRSPAIADTRAKSQLDSVGEMTLVSEHPSGADVCDELHQRLAVRVLQVLRSQPVTVEVEQERAFGQRDPGDSVGRVSGPASAAGTGPAGWNRSGAFDRHTRMSIATPIRPPLNFTPLGKRG
jgi:hypothetical protein